MKKFYDHLVVRDELIVELDKHQLMVEEREELIMLIDENLHHQVLDVVLTHLPKDKHEHFFTKLQADPADETILVFLKESVEIDIEEEIKTRAKKVKYELLGEIKRAKKT